MGRRGGAALLATAVRRARCVVVGDGGGGGARARAWCAEVGGFAPRARVMSFATTTSATTTSATTTTTEAAVARDVGGKNQTTSNAASEKTTTTTTAAAKSAHITRAGARSERRGHDDASFRVRKSVDATTDVEWEGQTFTGSRLEYAGVEVRGKLRWPIPLHALTQINPELKELLEVTKTNIGDEERMSGLLSVLNDGSGADADGRVVAKSASPSDELVPGMEEFRDFLEKSNWRANAQRVEKAKSVREYLSSEARKTTALKMNTATTPLSKTLLGKIKVAELRQAAADLDLGQVMMGVSKKAHITAYLLAFYEYMFGSVDLAQLNNKGVRMSDASQISAHIMEDAQREMKNSSSSQKSIYNDDVKTRALEHETSPDRMNYVKAFHADELVDLLVRARGIDVMAINVRDQCTWTDHLIIATARSFHHLKALAGAVLHAVKARTEYVAGGKLQPIIEGAQNGGDRNWMAVDCGSCMVHIFSPEGRALYNLEELWADGTETKHNGPDALSLDTITVPDEDLDTHTTTA